MAPGKTNLDDAVTEACKALGKPTRAKIRAYVQANFWLTAPNLDVNASINAAVSLAVKRGKITKHGIARFKLGNGKPKV